MFRTALVHWFIFYNHIEWYFLSSLWDDWNFQAAECYHYKRGRYLWYNIVTMQRNFITCFKILFKILISKYLQYIFYLKSFSINKCSLASNQWIFLELLESYDKTSSMCQRNHFICLFKTDFLALLAITISLHSKLKLRLRIPAGLKLRGNQFIQEHETTRLI